MIRFACSCGEVLEVSDELAGDAVQCHRCSRLRSVPRPEELAELEVDGTFRLADDQPPADHDRNGPVPARLTGSPQAPAPDGQPGTPAGPRMLNYADSGIPGEQRLDIRQWLGIDRPHQIHRSASLEPDSRTGAQPLPADIPSRRPPGQQPSPPAPPASRPRPGGRHRHTLAYAHRHPDDPSAKRVLVLELLEPANVLVLGSIFGIHLIIQLFMVIAFGGICVGIFLGGAAIALLIAFVAHLAVVVEETGPDARDELPPLLRDVRLSDDFLLPLWRIVVTAAICFALPALLARSFMGEPEPLLLSLVLLLGLAGLAFFPAVLLTAIASGHWVNLAPGRLLQVVRAGGFAYIGAVITFPIAVLVYASGLYLTFELAYRAYQQSFLPIVVPAWVVAMAAYPLLFFGIYLLHLFVWTLGRIYQRQHENFGWLFQKHISSRTDEMKVLERQKLEALQQRHEAMAKRASERVRSRLASE